LAPVRGRGGKQGKNPEVCFQAVFLLTSIPLHIYPNRRKEAKKEKKRTENLMQTSYASKKQKGMQNFQSLLTYNVPLV